eukprot:CAMPEP_0115511706 /NCGR_PEP_ID=MMETSP0271-20121206/74113_1 /TAXON_ID=71861 /ORGANISM="Scrippsiella trochoidea, Strain CCMP3099" /LENGTH=60 /DNA_ID=CAMNT_0002941803 /DNA_START=45 /DNA_END=224 /DNA_ORIENTATION=+
MLRVASRNSESSSPADGVVLSRLKAVWSVPWRCSKLSLARFKIKRSPSESSTLIGAEREE